MTEHSKGTQNGAKLRPQNKVRNLEHQAMRGNKTFWKTTRRGAPAYAPCPESGLEAHAVIENPIYCGRMTMTMLALMHCPKCDTRIVKLKLTKKQFNLLSNQKNQL